MEISLRFKKYDRLIHFYNMYQLNIQLILFVLKQENIRHNLLVIIVNEYFVVGQRISLEKAN